jgi:Type 9 secretion system plug protein 1st domain
LKKYFLIFAVFLFLINIVYAQAVEVKSLKYYAENNQEAFPVIDSRSGYLTIEFDLKAVHIPDLSIVFRFCDMNWKPYDNLFLANFGKNTARSLGFVKLPTNVQEADYHFRGQYPNSNDYVEFPFSGNWMFYITDAMDTSIVYGYGKFYVVQDAIEIQDTLTNETLESGNYFPTDLGKVFNITTNFVLSDKLFPSQVSNVTIIENRKIDYPIVINRNFNTDTRMYYWDANRKFTFTAKDIRPGNEYRQVDLRNINLFNSVNVNAQIDGLEYSRFFKEGPKDHNGASVIDNFTDPNSIYLNVYFSIRPPDNVYGDVFLVGSFNNWDILPDYRMNYNDGIFSKTITLKRGVYDYQYVLADYQNGNIAKPDWYILEGNSWETVNEYNIFVYYNESTNGGYDRIIAHSRIFSR